MIASVREVTVIESAKGPHVANLGAVIKCLHHTYYDDHNTSYIPL